MMDARRVVEVSDTMVVSLAGLTKANALVPVLKMKMG